MPKDGHLLLRKHHQCYSDWVGKSGCVPPSIEAAGNQCLVRLQTRQIESITGTSTSTPTTVTNAAPDSAPKSAIAVATANSKKLLAPINAPGAATEYGTFEPFHQSIGKRRIHIDLQ